MKRLAALVVMLAVFHGEHAKAENFDWIRYREGPEQTIASGVIDPEIKTNGPGYVLIPVDTEADAGTDNLDTISNPLDGSLIIIRPADGARTIVITEAGNIECANGATITLDEAYEFAFGFYNSTLTKWILFGMTDDFAVTEIDLETVTLTGILDTEFLIGTGAGTANYAPISGDITITNAGVATIQPNSVALGTDTTGNYAAGDAEAGAALTGDSATAFFSAGTIETARLPAASTTAAGTAETATQAEVDAGTDTLRYVTAETLTNFSGLSSGGAFTDGDPVILNTTTNDIIVSGAAQIAGAKASIDGDTDQIQFAVQGHSTQTTDLALFETSGGTDMVQISGGGKISVATGFDGIGAIGITYGSADIINHAFVTDGGKVITLNDSTNTVSFSMSGDRVFHDTNADGTKDVGEEFIDQVGAAGTLNTIKENDVQVGGADIVTLDFLGADFDLAETPDTEIQVIINGGITRTTEIDTAAEINALTTDQDFLLETLVDGRIRIGNGSNVATPVLLSGDVLVTNAGVMTIQANSVALTTDTTGNYAAGDSEAGAALTGDTATAFFSAGTIETARLPAASTTAAGTTETATQAEVDAGTDTLRYVTPETLTNFSGLGGGGGGSGEANEESIAQVAHGFAVGDVIREGASGWVDAQADSSTNAEALGIVAAVADVDNFTVNYNGRIDGLTGLTADTLYFLSDATAALLTATEPTTGGSISKPMLWATSTTEGVVIQHRGIEIGAATGIGLVAIIEEQQTSGTNAGTATSGSWVTRVLNTEVYDGDSTVSIASNIVTFATNGTYMIKWRAPSFYTDAHQSRLFSVDESAVEGYGTIERSPAASSGWVTSSEGSAVVTVTGAGDDSYRIEHKATTTRAAEGWGVAGSLGTEVYSRMEIYVIQ